MDLDATNPSEERRANHLMKYRVLGGKDEIGGNCIELSAKSSRLILDMGVPLSADGFNGYPLPEIEGLLEPSDDLLGVVVTHSHPDHYGMLAKIGEHVPVYTGQATKRILETADPFVPFSIPKNMIGCLQNRASFELGPFEITPYLVDHSAYDSYALLVEADGTRLFYTGDLRGHGRKARLVEDLLRDPPKDIDTLLIEGTRILPKGESDSHGTLAERDVEEKLVAEIKATTGMLLVSCSSQNIDRLVSIYRACLRSHRTLIVDYYTALILKATGNPKIPSPGSNNLKVFLPRSQKRKVQRMGDYERLDKMRSFRIFPENLHAAAPESVLIFRTSMIGDLEDADCLEGARAVWSLWSGYLDEGNYSGEKFREFCKGHNIPWKVIHSSGHADEKLLRELERAIKADETIFVHTNMNANTASNRES